MSLEEVREQNKCLVIEKSLELFVKNGIEQTKITDISKAAGLTERSIYRYFETKTEIILATAFLFWEQTAKRVSQATNVPGFDQLPGIERIRLMLYFYSSMYVESPDSVRYILNAETALFNAGVTVDIRSRPPGPFENSDSPMVKAINAGLRDGSVSSEVNVRELYYNAYDSILGVMERMILGATSTCSIDAASRMKRLCEMFVSAFEGKV
jgi:AcrR family transcriptional regulator